MKKCLLSLLFLCMGAVMGFAAKPQSASEGLFVENLMRNEHTDVSIITSEDSHFKTMTVNGDKKIVDMIIRAVEADCKTAVEKIEKFTGKTGYKLLLVMQRGEYQVTIGFDKYSDQDARIFVSGPPEAFGK